MALVQSSRNMSLAQSPRKCRNNRDNGSCWCHPAGYFQQRCPCCSDPIHLGDCIENNGACWKHTLCRTDESRGLASIEFQLIARVDYEFVREPQLAIANGTPNRPSAAISDPSISDCTHRARRRLHLPSTEDPAASPASGAAHQEGYHGERRATMDQDGRVVKIPRSSSTNYTKEQEDFAAFVPPPGSVVRGNACAGSGKTTMAALLCERISQRNPAAQIGYFVFGRGNMEEAQHGNKFGKNVHVNTTHAYAKKLIASQCKPVNSHQASDVMAALGLEKLVSSRLDGTMQPKKRRKIALTVTRYVIKTLNKFCQTADERIERGHVPFMAHQLTIRNKWRAAFITDNCRVYLDCARQLWELMDQGTLEMTHDFYLKKFQLSKHDIGVSTDVPICTDCNVPMLRRFKKEGENNRPFFGCANFPGCREKGPFQGFDVIILDEAQDLTPCQASAFWERPKGKQCVIYLLGDDRQRLYRWRGVRDNFKNTPTVRDFHLSNSFRFGVNIGHVATRILKHSDANAEVRGVAKEPGRVIPEVDGTERPTELAVVVITRSNKGMVMELLRRREILGRWPRWSFVDAGCKKLIDVKEYQQFVAFYKKEETSITVKGETFDGWSDLKEFVEDEEDGMMLNMLHVIENLEGAVDILGEAQQHFVENWRSDAKNQTTSAVVRGLELLLTTAHKAKGMEFDSLLLGHDFADRLPTNWSSGPDGESAPAWTLTPQGELRQCDIEEANILYVSVTRARRVLQLPPAVWQYLELLEEAFPDLEAPAGANCMPSSARFSGAESDPGWAELWSKARDEYMARWASFFGEFAAKSVKVEDIPFPDERVLGMAGVEEEEVKRFAHWMYRRFHSDKFFARFSVDHASESEVKDALCAWFQRARGVMNRGGGEDAW